MLHSGKHGIALNAGTLLVKDGSHAVHEQFFTTESVLTPEEKVRTKDFYKFQPQVCTCNAVLHQQLAYSDKVPHIYPLRDSSIFTCRPARPYYGPASVCMKRSISIQLCNNAGKEVL